MARQRINWNLSELCNLGIISTSEKKVEVPKAKGSKEKVARVVTVVGRVLNVDKFREAVETAVNKVRGDENKLVLSYEYLLASFVTDSIITNTKQSLRIEADPSKAVENSIRQLRAKFPHLSEDQLKAMAAMLLNSMQ